MSWVMIQIMFLERLGGSVSGASDFSSGHDLMVCEFEPHMGLCTGSRFSVPLSLPLPHAHSLSLKNK